MHAAALEAHDLPILQLPRPSRGGLPARIGRYTVLGPLGLGGMALVLRVRCDKTGELRAMKVLQSRSATHLARFEAEALVMESLVHPHVPRVYDFGYDAVLGLYYLVMELACGSAAEVCRSGRLMPSSRPATWVIQALCALSAAHERGIVHRDVKPSNLLLADDDRALLADFGIARMAGVTPRTAPDAVLGSPPYMAPEQREDPDEVGPEADLYGAGATLFYLSGRSCPDHLWMAREEDPCWDIVPEVVRAVSFRATRPDPADRYLSAREMAHELAPLVPRHVWSSQPHLVRWLG
jgi:serine/threonine protein kinase